MRSVDDPGGPMEYGAAAKNNRPSSSGPATLNEVLCAELEQLRPALLVGIAAKTFADSAGKSALKICAPFTSGANPLRSLRCACPAEEFAAQHSTWACCRVSPRSDCWGNSTTCRASPAVAISPRGSEPGWRGRMLPASSRRWGLRIAQPRNPLAPEPAPVVNLREYSNYLTPHLGLFSGDTWAAAGIIARNLLLNWLVLVPLLAAVTGIPLLFRLVVHGTGIPESWHRYLLCVALGIELLASLSVYSFRRFAKRPGIPQSLLHIRLRTAHLAGGRRALHGRAGSELAIFDAASLLQRSHRTVEVLPACGVWPCPSSAGWRRDPGVAISPLDLARAGRGARSKSDRRPGLFELVALGISGSVGAALLVLVVTYWLCILLRPRGCLCDPGPADIAGHLSDLPGAVRGHRESGRRVPTARLERRCRPRVVGPAFGLGIAGDDGVDRRHGYLPVRPLPRGVVRQISSRRPSVNSTHRRRESVRGRARNTVRRVRGIFGQQRQRRPPMPMHAPHRHRQ